MIVEQTTSEAAPLSQAMNIVINLSLGRISEYGANSMSYQDIINKVPDFSEPDMTECLE